MALKTRNIKCDGVFVELVDEAQKKYQDKNGIDISLTKLTKLIAIKIKAAGGLII